MSVLDGISIFWSILAVFYLALAINSWRLYLQTKRVGGVKIGKKGLLVGGSLDQEHSIITSQKVGIDIVNQEDLVSCQLCSVAKYKTYACHNVVWWIGDEEICCDTFEGGARVP